MVIFLDLDDFKVVNDGLGHAIGDELLMEAARRLRDSVRPSDTVARLGGDEFVMICELDRVHQVAALCDRIANVLARPVVLAGHTLAMSASIGVAIGEDSHSPDELLRDADLAMYRSKADGRGRSTLFTNSLRAEAVERLEQEADLRVALREDQLEVHVQPIVGSARRAGPRRGGPGAVAPPHPRPAAARGVPPRGRAVEPHHRHRPPRPRPGGPPAGALAARRASTSPSA